MGSWDGGSPLTSAVLEDGLTFNVCTRVGIAYNLLVQFYLYVLILHVRISHTVGLYNVFSLLAFSNDNTVSQFPD